MKEKSEVKSLAQMANMMATLNGGIVGSFKKLLKLEDCLKLEVSLPGISTDAVRAEVKDNHLIVRYMVDINSRNLRVKISNVVYNEPLPYFVDITRLSAKFSSGKLDITMPYNQFANGFNQILEIGK